MYRDAGAASGREWSVTTRREFLTALLGTAGAALLLDACGPSTGAPAAPTGGQLPVLKLALSNLKGETFDPIQGHPEKILKFPLFDYLVGVNAEGTDLSPATGIATKWTEAPDSLSWTFTLREEVPWHKGNGIVTAEDAAFTISRLIGPDIDSANTAYFKNIARVEAPNPQTLIIHLKRPAYDLPIMLSSLHQTEGMLLPKAYYEKVGRDGFRRSPVGSGPYEFVSQSIGSGAVFQAVEKHWSLGVPRYKRLEVRLVPEDATRIAMLKKGDVNFIDVPRSAVAQVSNDDRFTVAPRIGDTNYSLMFLQQWKPGPLANENVRAALSLGVDRRQIVKLFGSEKLAKVSTNINVCQSWNPACPTLTPTPYDPQKAKKLLADAGVGSGFEVEIVSYKLYPEQSDVSEALAGFFQAIGVRARVVPMDFAAWRASFLAGKLPANTVSAHENSNAVSNTTTIGSFYSKTGTFHSGDNPPLEPLLASIRAARTKEESGKALSEASRFVYEHFMEAPLVTSGQVLVFDKTVRDKGLGGKQYVDIGLREMLSNP